MSNQESAAKQLREVYNKELRKNDRLLAAGAAAFLPILVAILAAGTFTSWWMKGLAIWCIISAAITLVLAVANLLFLEKSLRHVSQAWAYDEGHRNLAPDTPQHIVKDVVHSLTKARMREMEKAPKDMTLRRIRFLAFTFAGITLAFLMGLAALQVLI